MAIADQPYCQSLAVEDDQQHACDVRYPHLIRHLPLVNCDQVWFGDIIYIRLGTPHHLVVVSMAITYMLCVQALSMQVHQALTLTAIR